MRALDDEITFTMGTTDTVVKVVPAYVSTVVSAILSTPDQPGRVVMTESLRAVVDADAGFDPNVHQILWDGIRYRADGLPIVRKRRGIPHHVTIPLTRTTG